LSRHLLAPGNDDAAYPHFYYLLLHRAGLYPLVSRGVENKFKLLQLSGVFVPVILL